MTGRNETASESPEKRRAILEQAIRTFAEVGFRSTDVQVIADRAGVGKGTVYRYFGNKEELFWATTFEVLERLERHMFAAMEGIEGARAKLRAAGLAHAGFLDADPQYLEIFVQDRAEFRGSHPESHQRYHEKLIARFVEIIEQGIADGELRPVDARETVLSFWGLLYGSVVHSCYAVHNYTLTELTRHSVDIFLKGIRAEVPQYEKEHMK